MSLEFIKSWAFGSAIWFVITILFGIIMHVLRDDLIKYIPKNSKLAQIYDNKQYTGFIIYILSLGIIINVYLWTVIIITLSYYLIMKMFMSQ